MSQRIEQLKRDTEYSYQSFIARCFARFALLALAFGLICMWSSSIACAQAVDRWGSWQHMVASDPLVQVEIQLLPPEHSSRDKVGIGTWYYRVRNVSPDYGVCLQFMLYALDGDVLREIKVNVRLNPNEQQKSWETNKIRASKIESVYVTQADQYEHGLCFHSASTRLTLSDDVTTNANEGVGEKGGFGSGQHTCGSLGAYRIKGIVSCTVNDDVRTACTCPGGMLLELQFPERMTICHCPFSTTKWIVSQNACTERSSVCFSRTTIEQQTESVVPQDEGVSVTTNQVSRKQQVVRKKPRNQPAESHSTCVVNQVHAVNSCACPSGTAEAMLPQGRGICHCASRGMIWSSSKNACISGLD